MARQPPGDEEIEQTRYGDARHETPTDEEEATEVDVTRYGPPQHDVEAPDPEIAIRVQYEDDHWLGCPPETDADEGVADATPDAMLC